MTQSNKKEGLTHVDTDGKAHMVDVGEKPVMLRTAVATGVVTVSELCARRIAENNIKKGDVLATAQLAGIMAAKRTAELIPLCHPLRIDHIEVDCQLAGSQVKITATVSAQERTGVEMEALTAVTVAALTIFDMGKAVDPAMVIGPVQVEFKLKDNQLSFDRSKINGPD